MTLRTSPVNSGSSDEVGSSNSMILGSRESARAMAGRSRESRAGRPLGPAEALGARPRGWGPRPVVRGWGGEVDFREPPPGRAPEGGGECDEAQIKQRGEEQRLDETIIFRAD